MPWRLAVFLSLLLGEVLAAPFPGKYSLPNIPYGGRIQYYILRNDGSYKEGYDTGDGQFQSAVASDTNEVDGQYGFTNPEGEDVSIRYKSGIQGFIPEAYGIVIPKTGIRADEGEFVDPLANPNPDSSYSFGYKATDHGRSETSDTDGNIQGEYHFYSEDGNRYRYRYRAGADQGFVVDIDSAPAPERQPKQVQPQQPVEPQPQIIPVAFVQPKVNVQPVPEGEFIDPLADPNVDGSYSFSYKADDHGRTESSDSEGNILGEYHFYTEDGRRYMLRYTAGADKGFVVDIEGTPEQDSPKQPSSPKVPSVSPPEVPVVPKAKTESSQSYESDPNVPKSYSFSYNTGDQEHTQTSDSEGKVSGNFAFVADDGVRRRVDYKASSETGFIAEGDHLPKQQEDLIAKAKSFEPQRKEAPVQPQAVVVPAPVPAEDASDDDDGADRSYSFNYHAGDSARTEISDKEGKITGFFTFLDDNNEQKTVVYHAGRFIGFLADGEHLPVRTDLPLPKFAIPSLYPVDRKSADPKSAAEVSHVRSTLNPDGSYTFSFVTSDQSRTETGTADGQVTGSFTFVADEGQMFSTNYEAGEETGFVAKGAHLPQPPLLPAVPKSPIVVQEAPTPVVVQSLRPQSIPVAPVSQIIPVAPVPQIIPVAPVSQIIPVAPVAPAAPARSPPVILNSPVIPPVPVVKAAHDTATYKFGERIQLPEGVLSQWLAGDSPEEYGYIYKED